MIIALAGRRIDPPDAAVRRFPLENEQRVRTNLRALLTEQNATAIVCSAACGADLLALDVAGDLHMRRRIILPAPRDEFRATSVVDRPGDWGVLYDRICDDVEAQGELIILPPAASEHEGYVSATHAIIDQALALAHQHAPDTAESDVVRAVVV